RRVPHVRHTDGNEEPNAVVLLKNLEFLDVLWVRRRHSLVAPFHVRLVAGVERTVFGTRLREELGDPPELSESHGGLDPSQGNEVLHVRLENRTLVPRAERLIDVRVDASGRDVPDEIGRGTAERVDEERGEDAASVRLGGILLGGGGGENRQTFH